MRDPLTVAFDIKSPFRFKSLLRGPTEYRPTLVTIWHKDPCRDGSDDSCGSPYPKLTERQRKRLRDGAWMEGPYPYFLRSRGKEFVGDRTELEAMYRGVVVLTARVLRIPITFDEVCLFASLRVHDGGSEDVARLFCFLPGYDTNWTDDRKEDRVAKLYGIMASIARELLRERRHWWQHPRWHIHHWRLQVHFLQNFKRWAFSRCAGCGKRFVWGEAPTTHTWDGGGPRWFRSERDVWHMDCSGEHRKGAA